jgi:RNAse (barnase) inhibitor barstar
MEHIMEHFDRKLFLSLNAPWAFLLAAPEQEVDRIASLVRGNFEGVVRIIRGERCSTVHDLFDEWAAALEYPHYFGQNWDAFEECITDLEWLPATCYVFFVTQTSRVLVDAEQDFTVFVDVLGKAAEEWATPKVGEWARPAVPFRIVFQCEPDQRSAVLQRLNSAGARAHLLV